MRHHRRFDPFDRELLQRPMQHGMPRAPRPPARGVRTRIRRPEQRYDRCPDGGGQVHGIAGLYVMDGSVFPSTLGVNPQITIMSIALALSRRLL